MAVIINGTTGIELGAGTSIDLPSPLPVSEGGTGAGTLTGLLKGNGTSAFTAAAAGTDYQAAISATGLLKGAGSGSVSAATAGTDYVTPTGTETVTNKTVTGLKYSRDDDGTISGGTWAIDYANGPVIRAQAGANITSITTTNWPASGTAGHLRLICVNFGAYTITFPAAWNWIKTDLTTTTTFSGLGITLPASGPCFIDLFTTDGGTTVYATIARN